MAAKDEAHDFRFAVDDDELAVLRPIPERRKLRELIRQMRITMDELP